MKNYKYYLKILQCGTVVMSIMIFVLLALLVLAQAAPYYNYSLPLAVTERGEELASVKKVSQAEKGLFATIVFTTKDEVSVPKAKLFINGTMSGDFSEGRLYVRVYEGDKLEIDARDYQTDLLFKIEQMSANLDQGSLNSQLIINNDISEVGIVHFK
ncbi:MAG: hypothetical protein ACOX05_02460 [Bacillota bacterium]|jgi:hypothetical protein